MNVSSRPSRQLRLGLFIVVGLAAGCNFSAPVLVKKPVARPERNGNRLHPAPALATSTRAFVAVVPANDSPLDDQVRPTNFELQPFSVRTEQQVVAEALGYIGPPAVPELVAALKSPDPLVRKNAAEVLARMGSDAKPAVAALVQLLDDPDETIRKTAARTLGRIGPDAAAAVPALMRTLMQAPPEVPQPRRVGSR